MDPEYHDCNDEMPSDLCVRCVNYEKYRAYVDALTLYAWWKDGHQEVGSCGTTLKDAIARAKKEFGITEEVQ